MRYIGLAPDAICLPSANVTEVRSLPYYITMNSLEQHKRMTETPIPRLITSLAIPTVASQLIMVVYNTADTYFVSRISTAASGAVGIVFALQSIIQAVGFGVAVAAGVWVAGASVGVTAGVLLQPANRARTISALSRSAMSFLLFIIVPPPIFYIQAGTCDIFTLSA